MKGWLKEVREQAGEDIVLHVVGCKIDLIAEEPSHRAVPFEQTVSWLASEVAGVDLSPTPNNYSSPSSKRSSMLWHQEEGWDNCSEVTGKCFERSCTTSANQGTQYLTSAQQRMEKALKNFYESWLGSSSSNVTSEIRGQDCRHLALPANLVEANTSTVDTMLGHFA